MLLDVEESVLAMILTRNSALAEARRFGLTPRHFRSEKNAAIYQAIVEIGEGDLVALYTRFPDHLHYLLQLACDAPLSLDLAPFLHEIVDTHLALEASEAFRRVSDALARRQPWMRPDGLRKLVSELTERNWL